MCRKKRDGEGIEHSRVNVLFPLGFATSSVIRCGLSKCLEQRTRRKDWSFQAQGYEKPLQNISGCISEHQDLQVRDDNGSHGSCQLPLSVSLEGAWLCASLVVVGYPMVYRRRSS